MLVDLFITAWNTLVSAVKWIISLPGKMIKLVKRLIVPTKKVKSFKGK